MDCKTSSALIMSYVDGTIEENEWANLQEHMKTCRGCKEEFEIFTEMIDLIEEMPLYEPSTNFENKVMEAIDHSLYTEKNEKAQWKNTLYPIIIAVGIYITFAAMFIQQKGQMDVGGLISKGAKILQQMSVIGTIAEKLIVGGYGVLLAFPVKVLQYVIGHLSWSPTNLLLSYGFSLGILLVLLKMIKGTLMELLKMDGGDFKWKQLNLEK